MVKHFLRNTDQEVKIGDKIRVKVPVNTPYGNGNCEMEILVTQASLEQLYKDNLVEKREISETPVKPKLDFEDYKPYIRRLARKMGASFNSAGDLLGILLKVSPHAHNCILIDMMSEVMNRDKNLGDYVYIVNLGADKLVEKVFNKNVDLPKFASFEDAQKAAILITPFALVARHAK